MKKITHADRLAANIVVAQRLGIKQEYFELARDLMRRSEILTSENYEAFKAAAIQARKDWTAQGLNVEAIKLNKELAKQYNNEELLTKFEVTDKNYLRLEIDIDERTPDHYLSISVSNMMNDEPNEAFTMNKALTIALKIFFDRLEIV